MFVFCVRQNFKNIPFFFVFFVLGEFFKSTHIAQSNSIVSVLIITVPVVIN